MSWYNMKQRCLNERATAFEHVGGRGIKVCDRWLHSFQNFSKDMGTKPKGTRLNRMDRDGDFEKDNCRWVVIQPKRRK